MGIKWSFAPNAADPTVNPPGFQEWMSFYIVYRVNMAIFDITIVNASTQFLFAQVLIGSNPMGWSTLKSMEGNRWCKTVILNDAGSTASIKKIRMVVPMAKFLGSETNYEGDNNYVGNLTSNPANIINAWLSIYTMDNSSPTSAKVNLDVRITQYAKLFGRIELVGEAQHQKIDSVPNISTMHL